MTIFDYLKDNKFPLILRGIFISFIIYLLCLIKIDSKTIIFIGLLWIVLNSIEFFYKYLNKQKFYNEAVKICEELDKKYLLPVIIKEPDFVEGKIAYNILSATDKSMNEEVNRYKFSQQEYREYIDMWVHEIKTPISSSKLIIENNKNESTLSILEELDKIEGFIEQVLYYSKSNEIETDYIIKEVNLVKCVSNVIKRNKKLILQNNIAIDINNIESIVYCDSKWVEFILNQIIINSIKYIGNKDINKKLSTEQGKIKLYSRDNSNSIELIIEDNGIGIDIKDINKVFKKGYVGDNGRKLKKSTGIGLYISKKLADKMYIGLEIESTINEKTIVKMTFPKNNMTEI